jgi:hypothetical protein
VKIVSHPSRPSRPSHLNRPNRPDRPDCLIRPDEVRQPQRNTQLWNNSSISHSQTHARSPTSSMVIDIDEIDLTNHPSDDESLPILEEILVLCPRQVQRQLETERCDFISSDDNWLPIYSADSYLDIGDIDISDVVLAVESGLMLGIIQFEQRETVLNSSSHPREFWQLSGHHSTHAEQMIDCLYNYQDEPKLRLKLCIQIYGTQAIDSGGIFDDKISQIVLFLLKSNIFKHDSIIGMSTFARYDDFGYLVWSKYYYVLNQILYWFVLVHEIISYPSSMNPAIIAYGIYDSISQ